LGYPAGGATDEANETFASQVFKILQGSGPREEEPLRLN